MAVNGDRRQVLRLLAAHRPFDAVERRSLEAVTDFVTRHRDCFERTLSAGHVTASAWIVNASRSRVLLTEHRKLDKWLQLGGHCDGDTDPLASALREAREESGLSSLKLCSPAIFDVDVHRIPARAAEAGHLHYDLRFLLEADEASPLRISSESKDLAWVALDNVADLGVDASVIRMVAKTTAWPE